MKQSRGSGRIVKDVAAARGATASRACACGLFATHTRVGNTQCEDAMADSTVARASKLSAFTKEYYKQ